MPSINDVLAAISNLSGATGDQAAAVQDNAARNLSNPEPETSERNMPREVVGKTAESISNGTEVKASADDGKKGNEIGDSDKIKSAGKKPAEDADTIDSEEGEGEKIDPSALMQAVQALQALLFGNGSSHMIPPTNTPAEAISGTANPVPAMPLPRREQAVAGQISPEMMTGLLGGNSAGLVPQQAPVARPPERTM